jgi:hypothetical protein
MLRASANYAIVQASFSPEARDASLATVKFRTDAGVNDVDHQLEELFELHDLIERGPDWNCIESIHIELNPRRRAYGDTVEQSLQRKLSREDVLDLARALEPNPSLFYPQPPNRS